MDSSEGKKVAGSGTTAKSDAPRPPSRVRSGNRASTSGAALKAPLCSVSGCSKSCAKRQTDGKFFDTCFDHRTTSQMEAEAPVCSVPTCDAKCGVLRTGKGYYATCFAHRPAAHAQAGNSKNKRGTRTIRLSEPTKSRGPPQKRCEIRKSLIPNVGNGLFLMEPAKDGECVAL